jgi:uncharacterized protein YigE (DUF2233 family)
VIERFLPKNARRVCLLACLCLAPAFAAALECSQVAFRESHSTICHVDLRTDRLQLFLYDAAGMPFKSLRRLADSLRAQGEQLGFAMNAGMFREDYSPLGLLVMNGHQVHRINLATGFGNFYMKPNGVFVLTTVGAQIVESSRYSSVEDPVILATQSGPMLVSAGVIHPGLNPQGTSRNIRNGIGVINANEVIFAISDEPITFYEFALLFRERLKCLDALYLDGSVSSLYVHSLGRDDERASLGPIIGVTVPLR